MPKRPRDVNSLAKQIVDEATGEAEPTQLGDLRCQRGGMRLHGGGRSDARGFANVS